MGLVWDFIAEKPSHPALGSELFHPVPLVPQKPVAFPLNRKVALWLGCVSWRGREKEMQLWSDRDAEKTCRLKLRGETA